MIYPRISIVIPVYNGSNYMKEAIDSALSQTYDNYEVIVVNDGSNDHGKTEEIAKSYGDKIKYIGREDNKGIAYTLNEGIQNMSGDYFAWLSHDDLYKSDKLAQQVNYLNEVMARNNKYPSNHICLCGASENINSEGSVIRQRKMQSRTESIRSKSELLLDNLKNYGIGGCTVLIPRAAFEDAGGFDAYWRTMQDANMWFRLILKGYTFCYLDKRLVQSRSHGEETGRRLKDIYEKEKSTFQVWLTKQMIADKDLQDWSFYLKCASYQRKMQHKEASKLSLDYAKKLNDSFIVSVISCLWMGYSAIYGECRQTMKKLYWKLIVKG